MEKRERPHLHLVKTAPKAPLIPDEPAASKVKTAAQAVAFVAVAVVGYVIIGFVRVHEFLAKYAKGE